jgi:hypothetical protein
MYLYICVYIYVYPLRIVQELLRENVKGNIGYAQWYEHTGAR